MMTSSKARASGGTQEDDLAYDLEVRLAPNGELQDVLLDGESLWPIWFKVEWKGNGQLSAKIAGRRISTREGDAIRFVVADADRQQPTAGTAITES
jgi:hypothetical protein